ncbi:hypothetical protein THIOKS12560004 [Thiocapsa sp. KS1]|nr:hypothetical protein THIOKS12560004 [Thiocapsa sp. KS1]
MRRARRVMTDLHACLLSTPTVHTKASLCGRTRALGTITPRTHRRAARIMRSFRSAGKTS